MSNFERTKLLGFKVHKSEFGGYYWEDPGGFYSSEIGHGDDYETEEDAWWTADIYRMFGDE